MPGIEIQIIQGLFRATGDTGNHDQRVDRLIAKRCACRFDGCRVGNVELLNADAVVPFGHSVKLVSRAGIPGAGDNLRTLGGILLNQLKTDASRGTYYHDGRHIFLLR